jgi:hypothetical protein
MASAQGAVRRRTLRVAAFQFFVRLCHWHCDCKRERHEIIHRREVNGMASNPKVIGDRLNAIIDGWEEHASDATLGGMTLAQFKLKVKPSLDARTQVEDIARQLQGARVERNNADVASNEIADQIVNSVKGDSNFGENSALYASFGYIRKADRKSGLHRKTVVLSQPDTLKAAA